MAQAPRGLFYPTVLPGFLLLSGCWSPGSLEPTAPRLYVMDCGQLNRGPPTRYGLSADEVETFDLSDPCYLVVHRYGTLIWDLGILPDDEVEAGLNVQPPEGGVGSNQSFRSLRSQLQEIGYTPGQVTHLAFSHSHWDHIANANDFAGATWMVQREEYHDMFSEESRASVARGSGHQPFSAYAKLESGTTVLLDGDHYVFGDGSVVLLKTPCHTAGHQSLLIHLDNYGPVVLTGDLYHFAAERTLARMPEGERSCAAPGTTESRQKIERLLAAIGGELWIQHDIIQFSGLAKAPKFYD
jgi:N-acyl homoserine lactone hydrolase